jgi:hypothetical protein
MILAKHAAQDRQDAVVGPAVVLDVASQARHAVAVSGCRISLDQSVIPPSWFLGNHCCEVDTMCCGGLCCLAGYTCCGGRLLAFLK